jgi:hypothetical protein
MPAAKIKQWSMDVTAPLTDVSYKDGHGALIRKLDTLDAVKSID